MTGDPFNINIELGMEETNRRVEVLNAYFKTIGLELVFEKRIKELVSPVLIMPISYTDHDEQQNYLINPISVEGELINPIKYDTVGKCRGDGLISPALINPIEYVPIIRRRK